MMEGSRSFVRRNSQTRGNSFGVALTAETTAQTFVCHRACLGLFRPRVFAVIVTQFGFTLDQIFGAHADLPVFGVLECAVRSRETIHFWKSMQVPYIYIFLYSVALFIFFLSSSIHEAAGQIFMAVAFL